MAETPQETMTPHSVITEEDVSKALLADKGKDAVLRSWKIADFTKQGDNYACFVTSVQVDYSKGDKKKDVSYVVKVNPCRNIPGFEEMTNVIFIKESKFYQEILPELNAILISSGKDPLQFPRCVYANSTKDKEQIYFEDLRVRQFKMFDRRKGMDEDHAALVLKELARLHATSYLLQAKTPTQPVETRFDFLLPDWLSFTENIKDVMLPMLEGNLRNSVEMLKKVGYHQKAITWVENLVPQLPDLLTTGMQSEKFGTINHGDCWNNNVLFRYNEAGNPVEVILLDLQICRKASLAADLNYFLYTSLTGSVRVPNINAFISTYYSSYKEVLKAGDKDMYFTKDELLREFRDKNVLGAVFGMMIVPMLLMESDEVPDISGDRPLEETMADFRAKALDMLESNPLMKPRFLSIFDEFIDSGVIS